MARYVDAIDLDLSPDEAFAYLADFSTTAEWDPGVAEAERLTAGPIGRGTRFRVVVTFLGRTMTFVYKIIAYEPPHRLVLRGTNDALVSIDEIGFVPRGTGTRVTYEARLELTGLLKLADPILQVMLQHVGRLAVRGLRERTAGRGSRASTPDPGRAAARGGA